MADAEAIAEAASRPTMRFVAVKNEEQQSRGMLFRTRDLLVGQRTQLINALRGHLAEFGLVAAKGRHNLKVLSDTVETAGESMPEIARDLSRLYLDQITVLDDRITKLERALRQVADQGKVTALLQTMPGIGPVTALAIEAFAPPMEGFKRGRDFAAWLGLVPIQHSTGGKQRLGRTSKKGQRDIRRLLIIGAMAVVRNALRKGELESTWLGRMLSRKPRVLVAIALANKMARAAWAMLTKQQDFKNPTAATA